MSCIVGITDGTRSVLGGDSAGFGHTDIPEVYSLTTPKVFRTGLYAIGFTSSFRFGQILRYEVGWPPPPETGLEQFLVTDLVERLRETLRLKGFLRRYEDGRERGGQILIAVRGQLFMINEDFQVSQLVEPYVALGDGHYAAYGSLHSLAHFAPELALEQRARAALEAAARYVASVQEPFVFVST